MLLLGITIFDKDVKLHSTTALSTFQNFICFLHPMKYLPSFRLLTFLDSLDFDFNFKSGRKTRLFGTKPYAYSDTYHSPMSFKDNLYVFDMFSFVEENFPELNLNSCLINFYPDYKSNIPDHSDNEEYIAANSYILTISLGSSRKIFFKDKKLGSSLISVALNHGDILLFSKDSQEKYTHGIPSCFSTTESYMPRISATFRHLQDV